MDSEDDLSALLAAIARGDRAALKSVYGRESTRLFGIAMAILRDRDAAADVIQDAFVRVWERAGQFDPARGEARAWLGGIVRHRALDMVRARGRELPTDDPMLGDEAIQPTTLETIAAGREGARLRDCLTQLEEKNRSAIVLAFVHGLSHVQVAARLDLPLGTVKAWIRRGLLTLRACLGPSADTP
jgi:RNA polymerase sigma-70 factor (ECF subfamily)